ncbi:hypothetical protein SODALDRAFT_331478 [Sodiomyces alkalinus F11]|uniref:Tim44-like domain-containing protein n=1 Tax=Sodiomyces alkalinus (strain CBS 110278 / VKM F-3762 / F11) TaxID=1314773 RepID=A0A3N2Q4S6_SODAK|nr:hypothetical protein SODALDRAFT_331478 [Sodiomyces alkalinus F11]ROT41706.1 hypothetical protein SODALDRAFT_331478 [Sodiomyces alkalinus F11]
MSKAQLEDMSKMQKHALQAAARQYASKIFPGTFIPMPLSKVPKKPTIFFKYQYTRLKAKFWDAVSVVTLRWRSRPSIFAFYSKPRAGMYRSQALAAGKALHARLGQALAEGDRDTLREICIPELYQALSAAIDKRKPWERTTWSILQNHGARLVAHRVAILPPPLPKDLMVQQAVVAIDTTQSLDRVDSRNGESIPGAARVQRRTEYLALSKEWNSDTYTSGPWQVIGNVKETTLDAWQKEEENLKVMQAIQTEKALKNNIKGGKTS